MSQGHAPVASVVIPAHNEGPRIVDCLRPLVSLSRSLPLEIVVVANGCIDDTVHLASSQPGVVVLNLPEPSKTGALNAGDEVATAFPRLYLDADVVLDEQAVRSMIQVLSTDLPALSAPTVRHQTDGADLLVRAYFHIFRQLPSARQSVVGRGVYAVSEAGRARFGRFPDLLADDLFVNRLFSPQETIVSQGLSTVRTPRRWQDLLKVRTRLVAGNVELARTTQGEVGVLTQAHDFSATTSATLRALLALVVRRPYELPPALVYAAINTLARSPRQPTRRWQRDESSR
ncbi:glycosyltransferase [Ornithinimicrobium pratense]|uniref:4,4'-diaponeurosporenoate glycosyltransferase n=1 Tax=Ornithinimicrobium pratense TaxID=2593973 RepID=A0A5J6V7P0_9MICO|nr:glycosyltransferase [Ornithinimicrobium pratense]QFG69778.1 glycosyltransferase [Ornithinimicrobium pratense]